MELQEIVYELDKLTASKRGRGGSVLRAAPIHNEKHIESEENVFRVWLESPSSEPEALAVLINMNRFIDKADREHDRMSIVRSMFLSYVATRFVDCSHVDDDDEEEASARAKQGFDEIRALYDELNAHPTIDDMASSSKRTTRQRMPIHWAKLTPNSE